MKSITISLTGNSSTLTAYFHPEIVLDGSYSCCLLDFSASEFMVVTENNNKLHYQVAVPLWPDKNDVIEMPTGVYNFQSVTNFIENEMHERGFNVKLKFAENTSKVTIEAPASMCIDFTKRGSIGRLLGFDSEVVCGGNEAEHIVPNINDIAAIRINCDLITGSFHNGSATRTIHEFLPLASLHQDYKLIEQPKNLVYLPVVKRRINIINVTVVDQNGKLVNLARTQVSCRIHIKKD